LLSALAAHLKSRAGLDLASALSDGLVRFECLPGRSWRVSLDDAQFQSWAVFTALLLLSIYTREFLSPPSRSLLFPSSKTCRESY
jgi:hypothetical protein